MSDEQPASGSQREARIRLLKSYNAPILCERTEKVRDRLYVVSFLALAYVKLGIVPTEMFGFQLGDHAPAQLLSIIFMIFIYSWYLFMARYTSDLLGGLLEREGSNVRVKIRDWVGNAIGLSFALRYFMDVALPNIVAGYTLFQFGAADRFAILRSQPALLSGC